MRRLRWIVVLMAIGCGDPPKPPERAKFPPLPAEPWDAVKVGDEAIVFDLEGKAVALFADPENKPDEHAEVASGTRVRVEKMLGEHSPDQGTGVDSLGAVVLEGPRRGYAGSVLKMELRPVPK